MVLNCIDTIERGASLSGRGGEMKKTKLNSLLYQRGMTGKDVAYAIGVKKSRYYAVASGHETTRWIRESIAEYLDVKPEKLWRD